VEQQINILPFARFYNLTKRNEQTVFLNQARDFVLYVWIAIARKRRDPAEVIRTARSLYRLKCWAFERIVSGLEPGISTKPQMVDAMKQAAQIMYLVLSENGRWSAPRLKARQWMQGPARHWAQRCVVAPCDRHELPAFDDIGWFGFPTTGKPGLWYDPERLYGKGYNQAVPKEEKKTGEGGDASIFEDDDEEDEMLRRAAAERLTASQTEAYARLEAFLEMRRGGFRLAGIDSRPIPLIVAPTGCGKSHLVSKFAFDHDLPLLALDSSSWIVSGATNRPYTCEIIHRFVKENSGGVLFLDEMCKMKAGCDWSLHVQGEVMSVLDGCKRGFVIFDEATRRNLSRFLIIGAGTWQSLHQANGKGMGFNPAATEIQDEIFRSGEIPVELLARFNRDFILLQPPTLEEFQCWIEDIHRDLEIDPPEAAVDLASEAVRSGLNTRWLEVYVSRLLMKYQPWIGDHPIDEHPDILF
jgi:hypothetical protein